MTEITLHHATIVAERRLKAAPERVFKAWAHERGTWDVPNDEWTMAAFEDDLRVDGKQLSRFGPKDDPAFELRGRYLVIEENRLLIMAGVMHDHGNPVTASMTTIDVKPDGDGTKLIVTEQSAFFGMETADMREAGWRTILDRFEGYMAAA